MNNIRSQDKVRHIRSGVTKDFFRFLENAGVENCAVGDTRSLSDEIRGDLDDVVREVNMRILDLMAARTARRLGLPDGGPRNVQ